MEQIFAKLTICFENPFWVGVYERESNGHYEVCKITFGAEPKDCEVYAFLQQNWDRLRFSPLLSVKKEDNKRMNPKRKQRDIRKQILNQGIGTKAQQALKLQQEVGKQARKTRSREEREADKERQYQLHQAKKKEKHRGH